MSPVRAWLPIVLCLSAAAPATAGDADVIGVAIRRGQGAMFNLDVTIRSKDTGWERFADRIEALGSDGTVLGTRVLEHPHDTEQPFTRDLYDLRVPPGIVRITIRAHFKPTGFDGATMTVALPGR
ncbi:MAG: hypothetical protein EXR07_10950 [Acetobacteraceae bacterium]|nr:hypothetical protein [Acetobacteraceae bacterium]